MYLDPTSKSLICADDFFCEISERTQNFHAARQPRRNDVGVFQKDFAVCLALQPRDPWLNRPNGVDTAALKQTKLIRVCRGQDEDVATGLRNFKSLRFQPGTAGNILSIAKLRRCEPFTAHIRPVFD